MSIKNALLLHLSGKKPNTGKSVPAKAIAQQALEPRLLLDAAAVSTLAEASGDVANDDNLNSAIQQLGPPRLSEWDQWIGQIDSDDATVADDESLKEIYIIDESVSDIQSLLREINDDADVYIIDSNSDGIEQVADILSSRTAVDAVHILSHGSEAGIQLGNTQVTSENLNDYEAQLQNWSVGLTDNADILFYGCEIGAHEDGQLFIESISQLTGADIAASTDDTGSASLGGDWDLELEVGDVDVRVIQATDFDGILAPPSIDLDFTGAPPAPGEGGFSAFSFSSPTITNDGMTEVANNGVGETALYEDVGSFNGSTLSLRATVVSSAGINPVFNLTNFGDGNDDNANVQLDAGGQSVAQAVVRWDIIDENGNPVAANFTVLITDLDRTSSANNSFRGEAISIAEDSVDGFVLNGNTDLTPTVSNGVLTFQPADADPGRPGQDPTNGVQLIFTSTSSFEITYDRTGAQNFTFDGNFDPIFTNPETIDTNPNHADVFTEGETPVSIATDAINITDEGQLQSATISLTNAQTNDLLIVPASLPTGITVDPTSTSTNIILVGAATADDYETAIKAVTFSNSSSTPDIATVREIEITVTDQGENLTSNVATTFITVVDVADIATDTDNDGVADDIDIDDDNDGILDTIEERNFSIADFTVTDQTGNDSSGTFEFDSGVLGSFSFEENSAEEILLEASGASPDGGLFFIFRGDTNFEFEANFSATPADPDNDIQLALIGNSKPDSSFTGNLGFGSRFSEYTISWTGGDPDASALIIDPAEQIVQGDGARLTNGGTFNQTGAGTAIPNDELGWSIVFPPGATDFTITAAGGAALEGFRFSAVSFDSDADGVVDRLDLDSDNDGITDNIEAQSTADYIVPLADNPDTADINEADTDGDGLNDAYDDDLSGAADSVGLVPVNTDGIDQVDYLDLDSDNDGVLDIAESGLGNNDTDGDGRTDFSVGANGLDNSATHEGTDDYSDVSGLGHNGSEFQLADSDDDTAADGSDASPTDNDLDYRDNVVPVDTDGDGVADDDDIDDDNDGVLDVDEGFGTSMGQFTHQNFKDFSADGVFGFATENAFNGEIVVENSDDPDNDREVDLEVGDVIVYSMNDGADLVAVEVVSITEGARVNAETTRPGESPKIEFRGIGEYQGEEERLRLEFAFYDPADAAFDGAADLGVIAERIQSGLGTSVEQTTSIRLGDVDDTGMGSNDNGFRIEGVGADLSSLHSYTLEDGGSFTPEIEDDGFVRFRGTVNNPDDDIQLNYLNTDRFEVELLNDADRTAGFGFGFRQSSFTNAITTAENGTDSDNDGIADHLDLDSDNDGITDNIEAQTTADYIAPNADSEADYIANQGVNSAYVGIAGFDQANTDGDEYVDRLDLDSDNDGVLDIIESGLGNNDTDGDGRTDATVGFNGLDDSATHEAADDFTDVSGLGHDGSTFQLADSDDDTAADGSDATPTETDLDYRDNVEPVDTDGDGVADAIDIDDDNDGILDVDEAAELIAVQGQLGFFHNGESNSDGSQTFGVVSYDPGASPNVTDILDLSLIHI